MKKIQLIRSLEKMMDVLPRRHPIATELSNVPFFAFGSGRNGSTLFNRMLNQHSELYAPPEQYFLGTLIARFKLLNHLPWAVLVDLLSKHVREAEKSDWCSITKIDWSDILSWGVEKRSLQELIVYLYQSEDPDQKRIWGDTTHLNYHYIPEIYSVFPNAKFIFMIRDGRAVVHSFMKAGSIMGDRSNPVVAAKQWMKTIKVYEELKSQASLMVLKYEDLVEDPKSELERVCEHLGVSYEDHMLQFYNHVPNADVFKLDIHKGLYRPVFSDSLSKWEDELPRATRNEVVRIMKEGLNKFGYV